MATIADMLQGRQMADLSPAELAQIQESVRMSNFGQGGELAPPTQQVQDIQQMVASGTQNPAPEAGGVLGPIAKLLAPLFASKPAAGPQPQATPMPTPQATPTPDQPCPDPGTDPAGYAICMEQKRAGQ